jgi:hypothetical protein
LFDEWSATAPESYDELVNRNQWESFKPDGGITIGTLFHIAKQHGWKPALTRSNSGVREEYFGGTTDSQADATFPGLVDAIDFLATEIPPPPELITGILHQGSKLVLGGSSKSHKTWTLLDLAISVATGTPWLGFATTRGKVLYANFEIEQHAWQNRIDKVNAAKKFMLAKSQLQLLNLRGHAADFNVLIPKILQMAHSENFALIILDPIYKLYGGTDENAARDVAALLNMVEHLAVESGAAVAFGAHFAKGNSAGKEAIDRISGSGVFARDPDSLLILTRHEADDAFTVEPILRNFAPVPPFVVRWEFPLMQPADDLDPHRLKVTVGRPRLHTAQDLLNLLWLGGIAAATGHRLGQFAGLCPRQKTGYPKRLVQQAPP